MAQKKKPGQTKNRKKPRKENAGKAADRLAEAALDLAQDKDGDWGAVTVDAVLRRAGLSPDEAAAVGCRDIWAMLGLALDQLDRKAVADVTPYLGDNWRDNLMEILMTRFDHAQKHRKAYAGIPESLARHPAALRKRLRPFLRAMKGILTLSRFPLAGRRQTVAAAGFGLIYLSIIRVWATDETPDMTKTMAAIDQRLGLLEKLSGFIRAGE